MTVRAQPVIMWVQWPDGKVTPLGKPIREGESYLRASSVDYAMVFWHPKELDELAAKLLENKAIKAYGLVDMHARKVGLEPELYPTPFSWEGLLVS